MLKSRAEILIMRYFSRILMKILSDFKRKRKHEVRKSETLSLYTHFAIYNTRNNTTTENNTKIKFLLKCVVFFICFC